jgi:tetratricopeptide (TPR) repeat protein
MTAQGQEQQLDGSQGQGQRRRRFSQRQLIISIVVTAITVALALTAAQVLANLGVIPRLWATIVSALATVFGMAFAFLALLPLLVRDRSKPATTSSPTFPTPQIIVHVPATQPLAEPPLDKTAHRGILGFPPPTDPRTIQQRESVVKDIYAKLTQPDITAIVLTGIGGVGKSTLAALVYRYSEEQRRAGTGMFQNEPIWLTINGSVAMADLAGTLFEAMGKPLPDFSSLSSHNQAVALFNALNTLEKARLIILDQFENLLDWQTGHALLGRPGVGEWLDAINSQKSTCRILLTSRPWPQGTREYPPTHMQEYHIKGLEVTEGVELLKKRGVEATEAELRTAVERCAGHAYALTFLASLLHNNIVNLSILFKDAMYAQLWTGDIAHNLLDYIYTKQLSKVQRKLLLAFSVYREPVPLDAAQVLINFSVEMPKTQVLPALNALRTQYLLQASGEGRYQLHAIVAGYAQSHFVEDDEQANQESLQAAHARAVQYYLQQAATTCPPREQRQRSSDVQLLIEAVWQHCQAEQWQEAYKLMEQEWLFEDLKRWGGNAILLELCQLLLPSDKWHPERSQEADIYNNLGEAYRMLGNRERAREYHEQALCIYQEASDRRGEAWALNYLGRVYYELGDKERARGYYEQALYIFKEAGDRKGEGRALNNLGSAYDDIGKKEEALAYYEQALSIYKQIGDRQGEGRTLNELGMIYNVRVLNPVQKERALKYCKEAVSILREVGDREREAWALTNLGRAYNALGQPEERPSHIILHVVGQSKLANLAPIPCKLLGDQVPLKQPSSQEAEGDAWTETSSPGADGGVGKYQTMGLVA